MSDEGVWLSVDPMKEKYPYQSPYICCGWNPIKIIDPDGMDGKLKKHQVIWKMLKIRT
jgi:hypothetical protein